MTASDASDFRQFGNGVMSQIVKSRTFERRSGPSPSRDCCGPPFSRFDCFLRGGSAGAPAGFPIDIDHETPAEQHLKDPFKQTIRNT